MENNRRQQAAGIAEKLRETGKYDRKKRFI